MAGIFDILSAAAIPAARARSGYLEGQETKRERGRAETEQERQIHRQEQLDREEQARYKVQQGRVDRSEGRQSVLDEARLGVERAQAEADKARAHYYERGGAAGARDASGKLTPKDRATYIRSKSMARYNPDTGEMEPGMSAERAAREFDTIVMNKTTEPDAPAGPPIDPNAQATTVNGATKYSSPYARRHGEALGGNPTPPAQRPDTAVKTTSPIDRVRDSMTTPKAAIDSATLSKKYPWLFEK